jgi:hypothetical protein
LERQVTPPTFSAKSKLVRYVDQINRLSGNRPAVATFLPDPPSANPANDHLSVNSLEIETMKEIAAYHRWKWQNNAGGVALCEHKVHEYSEAGKKCGIRVAYDKSSAKWMFSAGGLKREEAYKHRPVPVHNNPLGSPSHSGVEFARALKQHKAAQFARRLSGKKFHLLTE